MLKNWFYDFDSLGLNAVHQANKFLRDRRILEYPSYGQARSVKKQFPNDGYKILFYGRSYFAMLPDELHDFKLLLHRLKNRPDYNFVI